MLNPRACRSLPIEAAIVPLPKEEATPRVTKMYLVSDTVVCFLRFCILQSVYFPNWPDIRQKVKAGIAIEPK